MSKPDDIPQDVWDTAGAKAMQYVEWVGSDEPEQAEHVLAVTIAQAVLAERERCARLCEAGGWDYAAIAIRKSRSRQTTRPVNELAWAAFERFCSPDTYKR